MHERALAACLDRGSYSGMQVGPPSLSRKRKYLGSKHFSNCHVGQSNDAIFKMAKAGRITCKVEAVKDIQEDALLLADGERLPCDVLVVAFGLKYQAQPAFLQELNIGKRTAAGCAVVAS